VSDWLIRPLTPADDRRLAEIIRQVLAEFGADRPGFAWADASLDAMSDCYRQPRHRYLVAERDGELLGGAGIAPLRGGSEETAELQKMYLLPEVRGEGIGRAMMEQLLEDARTLGYRRVYLETLAGMTAARDLYLRSGFLALEHPMGATGHGGCDRWFLREL